MQLLAFNLGGQLEQSATREYGPADLKFVRSCALWDGIDIVKPTRVWMSHGDTVKTPPPGFLVTGSTDSLEVAAMADEARKIYAVQFHPEVHHTVDGDAMLRNFLFKICRDARRTGPCPPSWSAWSRKCAKPWATAMWSAPSPAAWIPRSWPCSCTRPSARTCTCIFVDNGVLRSGEGDEVVNYLREHFDLNLKLVNAQDRFLDLLAGVEDPEKKRKIIGHTFIDVFDEEARAIGNVEWLAQGTLYPDVIESVSHKGPSAVIKSHHNVGGLPGRR